MKLILEPSSEPLTVAEAKLFLRVSDSVDDDLIASLVTAARQHAEDYTRRALVAQTWAKSYDGFPEYFVLPKAPLISVSSIKYLDENGDEQTLASDQYRLYQPTTDPAHITPEYGGSWPLTQIVRDSVTCEFIAGYVDAEDVPADVKTAMKFFIGHMYDNREGGGMPGAVNALLDTVKIYL